MAKKKLVMRVGALALMGGAMALFAAQAGVLPGLDLGSETQLATGSRTPDRIERGARRPGRADPGGPRRRSASAGPDEDRRTPSCRPRRSIFPKHPGFAARP
jgi:hypothetical protein